MSYHYETPKPEVSVLMSCFNANRWLVEAIESVLAQTFNNYEFIIIDDGSTDNTREIIQQYASTDSRIVPILKENTGLADSLNIGIAKAKGRWIARLDADDLCEVSRLDEQLYFVDKNKSVVLLGSGFLEINEYGSIIKENLYPQKHIALLNNLERSKRFFPHSSAFFLTDLARSIGGYNKRISRAEDKRLWLDFALRGKIACLRKALVRVRKHSNQISLDQGGIRQLNDSIAATTCHYIVKQGNEDPSLILNEREWTDFLGWIDQKVAESGSIERQKVWASARNAFFSKKERYKNIHDMACILMFSGHFVPILLEKILGNDLPKKLAREWQIKNRATP